MMMVQLQLMFKLQNGLYQLLKKSMKIIIMAKTLNFDDNFNGKFSTHYFTTVRSAKTVLDKHLNVGDEVEILHKGIHQFTALIVDIDVIDLDYPLSHAQRTLLSLDVGTSWYIASRIVENYCKSKLAIVITLKNLSKE